MLIYMSFSNLQVAVLLLLRSQYGIPKVKPSSNLQVADFLRITLNMVSQ